MRYHVLAADYDGTLATDGRVDPPTVEALRLLKESGRKLVMVTGRELDQLLEIMPEIDLFDRVVAENGALLYRPQDKEEVKLAEAPPADFIDRLKARGVGPISVGRVIVATWEPHQAAVLDVVREMGLELQVIFNKGAVMILPSGVNKATGLDAALRDLGLSAHNVVAVGDAENDHAFLSSSECAVAVSNALPTLKERADWITSRDHGRGVVQLIRGLLEDDLAGLAPKLIRHHVLLGEDDQKQEVRISPYGLNILVAGTSGGGKSTLTTGLLERLSESRYQFVIVDPEGDYDELELTMKLGDPKNAPTVDEVEELLSRPETPNVSVNMLGIDLKDRPGFSDQLLPRLQDLRAHTGRPHWVVVDEVHHLMPAAWQPAPLVIPKELQGMLYITVHPDSVAPALLESVDVLLAIGEHPEKTIRLFCETSGKPEPAGLEAVELDRGETLAWFLKEDRPPFRVKTAPPKIQRRRHSRKYAEGNLGPDRSFYFKGPEGKLNLRAQNLVAFLQLAEGVDDATWQHHLQQGDYARWFREGIKDDELGEAAEQVAATEGLSAEESRTQIKEAIEDRYTLPAERVTSA
ncbi:HAD-IIB family hydrolase [Paludisphaera mucosa]|uniref:HAD-IIB family hydrolase n=1 Tax=Paludisphaera mucosa TaxID=3030827 RepID=A0ABT6FHI0_9BACT|nr:HAD-IIB family hydrolase [Paludisphaera mucosa]MDG3006941.1 HAD-IIB family hydrolase [Paludisphaera mucosa]